MPALGLGEWFDAEYVRSFHAKLATTLGGGRLIGSRASSGPRHEASPDAQKRRCVFGRHHQFRHGAACYQVVLTGTVSERLRSGVDHLDVGNPAGADGPLKERAFAGGALNQHPRGARASDGQRYPRHTGARAKVQCDASLSDGRELECNQRVSQMVVDYVESIANRRGGERVANQ
jgi:hypothetical protein